MFLIYWHVTYRFILSNAFEVKIKLRSSHTSYDTLCTQQVYLRDKIHISLSVFHIECFGYPIFPVEVPISCFWFMYIIFKADSRTNLWKRAFYAWRYNEMYAWHFDYAMQIQKFRYLFVIVGTVMYNLLYFQYSTQIQKFR